MGRWHGIVKFKRNSLIYLHPKALHSGRVVKDNTSTTTNIIDDILYLLHIVVFSSSTFIHSRHIHFINLNLKKKYYAPLKNVFLHNILFASSAFVHSH